MIHEPLRWVPASSSGLTAPPFHRLTSGSPLQHIDRARDVGVIFVTEIDAREYCLCLPIVFWYVTAALASATDMVWRNSQQHAATPRQLAVELAPELAPALD
jgi:hypothetical protein